jgi:2,4-dienoyl-CoA reductase-like NADH-dependent reductase (Old Yellow Enzyme family)
MSNSSAAALLTPLRIRGVTTRNRIVVSPMCQYSAVDGMADDWHLVHLGSRAVGGAGIVFVEATAVTRDGRITDGDLGIWEDHHIEPLERIARFITRTGALPGIQLAHAGRKASCTPPFEGGVSLKTPDSGAWRTVAPSPIPFHGGDPIPKALGREDIKDIVAAFASAGRRAVRAGFRAIEIHAAHGYLLHQFLSPLSNRRNDLYGGSIDNRMRFLLEVAAGLRGNIPDEIPLFVRISSTDWVEGGWDLDQSVVLARALRQLGVDLIDVSGGGTLPRIPIPAGPGYLAPFSSAIRAQAGVMTGLVGVITEPEQANEIIASGVADLVFLGREMLREPYWALKASQSLGQDPAWPLQYGYAVRRRK